MAKKTISWKTKGMNRDTSVSAFSSEFAFENRNLRLATNEGNTMLSWVNERGTKKMTLRIHRAGMEDGELQEDGYYPEGTMRDEYQTNFEKFQTQVQGTPIGTAVLNHQLVIFTTGNTYGDDNIYVFSTKKRRQEDEDGADFYGEILFEGKLGFSVEHPIETLVSYESENIQKVYWTDGINQPRFINIAPAMDKKALKYKAFSFDFVPELQLNEEVTVEKIFGSGSFPAGVIQYAFTYYNEYGQESCVFHVTPLQYISHIDRGGSAESTVSN